MNSQRWNDRNFVDTPVVWSRDQTVYPGGVHVDEVDEAMRSHKRWEVPEDMWEHWGDDLKDTSKL